MVLISNNPVDELKEELINKIQDIDESSDDETLEKLSKIHNYIENNDKIKNLPFEKNNDSNKVLSFSQRIKKALEVDVDIDPGRLQGLTDGIFGMVMTLLIFGIALPTTQIVTNNDFLLFVYSLIPNIGITIVSFILLASFWIYNHEFLKIDTLNMPYLWLNVFYLICISFIPLTTSIVGEYCHFFVANLLFGINIFLTLLSFMILFWYANKMGLLANKLSNNEKKYIYNTFFIIMGLTVIVNLLDFNISHYFFYLFLLVPITSIIRNIRFYLKHNI